MFLDFKIERWPPSEWNRLCASTCCCTSRGIPLSLIHLLVIIFHVSFTCLPFYYLFFLFFIVGFNRTRSFRDFPSCSRALVYREKRSNNVTPYTTEGIYVINFYTLILGHAIVFSHAYCRLYSFIFRLLYSIRDMKLALYLISKDT